MHMACRRASRRVGSAQPTQPSLPMPVIPCPTWCLSCLLGLRPDPRWSSRPARGSPPAWRPSGPSAASAASHGPAPALGAVLRAANASANRCFAAVTVHVGPRPRCRRRCRRRPRARGRSRRASWCRRRWSRRPRRWPPNPPRSRPRPRCRPHRRRASRRPPPRSSRSPSRSLGRRSSRRASPWRAGGCGSAATGSLPCSSPATQSWAASASTSASPWRRSGRGRRARSRACLGPRCCGTWPVSCCRASPRTRRGAGACPWRCSCRPGGCPSRTRSRPRSRCPAARPNRRSPTTWSPARSSRTAPHPCRAPGS
mmetsp:Transcript_79101/g.213978  ORF Transcript_79101/g.213978 Transcript_79101/m.213978 type:complete len:313 (+) Transcript_79101:1-939(+)